jgi:hypothetical protein
VPGLIAPLVNLGLKTLMWGRGSGNGQGWGGLIESLPASCAINKIQGDCAMVKMFLFEENGKP